MVERRGVLLALLPAALACPVAATLVSASLPGTRSLTTAIGMALLTLLAILLVVLALRHPNARTPTIIRLLLAGLAILQGAEVARAGWLLAEREGSQAWLGLTAMGGLGVLLAVVHLVLYRLPVESGLPSRVGDAI